MPKYSQYDVSISNNMVNFCTCQPNNYNLPMDWFQTACLEFATLKFGCNDNEHKQFLQYGAIEGYPDIRIKLADWLSDMYYKNTNVFISGINHHIVPEQVFMTNGNTGALNLLISKYSQVGDCIIVENPSYFLAMNMFNEFGLEVKGVNIECDGINIEELEKKIMDIDDEQNVIFYYMIPTHHNPTGITTSHEKRIKIAELCDKYANLYVIASKNYIDGKFFKNISTKFESRVDISKYFA